MVALRCSIFLNHHDERELLHHVPVLDLRVIYENNLHDNLHTINVEIYIYR